MVSNGKSRKLPDLNPFHNRPDEWALYEPLIGNSMLEFGGKVNGEAGTYKAFFEKLGYRHVSLDWNGEHGALKRDLRQPQWPEFGSFDYTVNMGCSEHVSSQHGFWKNVHFLTKPGGLYVGQTPYHDGKSWWWHGEYYPTEAFFESFADLNCWDIERMYIDREIPNQNLYVRMRKIDVGRFAMPDESLIKFNRRRPR